MYKSFVWFSFRTVDIEYWRYSTRKYTDNFRWISFPCVVHNLDDNRLVRNLQDWSIRDRLWRLNNRRTYSNDNNSSIVEHRIIENDCHVGCHRLNESNEHFDRHWSRFHHWYRVIYLDEVDRFVIHMNHWHRDNDILYSEDFSRSKFRETFSIMHWQTFDAYLSSEFFIHLIQLKEKFLLKIRWHIRTIGD